MALRDTPGGRMKQARMDRGLSALQFLEILGQKIGSDKVPTPGHFSNLENGKRKPSIDLAIAIADILQLSLDDIYDRESWAEEEYSPVVKRVADMLESMDEDTRALMLHNIEQIYQWDQERRNLHQEIYDLLTKDKPNGSNRLSVAGRLRSLHRSMHTS